MARIIMNPMYCGQYVYGRRSKKYPRIVVDDALEAIVTREQFERVNTLHQERVDKFYKKRPAPKNKGDEYILTGYTFCAYCGSHLYGFRSHKTYTTASGGSREYSAHFYRCARKAPRDSVLSGRTTGCTFKNVKKEDLEAFVLGSIEKIIFSDDSLAVIIEKIRERLQERLSKEDTSKFRSEITKIKNHQDRLLDLYLDGSLDIPEYNRRKGELLLQLEYFEGELAKHTTVFDPAKVTLDFVKAALAEFYESASADSPEYKKLILSTFIDSVVLDNEKIVIYFRFPLPGTEETEDGFFVRKSTTVSTRDFSRTEILRTKVLIRVEWPVVALETLDYTYYNLSVA